MLLLVFALALSCLLAAGVDHIKQGDDYFYDLEYEEAISAYERQRKLTPDDPNVYNHIATCYLYKELHRYGIAQSGAFKKGNSFLKWDKLELNPGPREKLEQYMLYGRHLAEVTLKKRPTDPRTLYWASQNYAFAASFSFLVDKAYLKALRRGNKAHDLSKKNIKHNPDFPDGYFVAGVQEYVIGSLPWVVRVLVALGGVTGDKEKGLKWVEMVAEEGDEAREQSRVVLTILYRREGRNLEAAELMRGLIKDYPTNYVFQIELGSIYRDADQLGRSLHVLRTLQGKVEQGEPGFGRMAELYRKRLQQEIEETEKAISTRAERRANAKPPARKSSRFTPACIPACYRRERS